MQVSALSDNQDKLAADASMLLGRLEAVEASSTPIGASYQVSCHKYSVSGHKELLRQL